MNQVEMHSYVVTYDEQGPPPLNQKGRQRTVQAHDEKDAAFLVQRHSGYVAVIISVKRAS